MNQSLNTAWDLGTSVQSINQCVLKIVKIKFKPFKRVLAMRKTGHINYEFLKDKMSRKSHF